MADTPRQIADRYLDSLARLSRLLPTELGLPYGADALDDFSPAGLAAGERLIRTTLAELDTAPVADAAEQRCATLLRERLSSELTQLEHGEELRVIRNLFSPMHSVRAGFAQMATDTEQDWSNIRGHLAAVPAAYVGYTATLREGLHRGLYAGPRQVATAIEQLTAWLDSGYFPGLVADGPADLRPGLDAAADEAIGACVALREFLRDIYAPAAAGEPDTVGRERYARCARQWTGSEVDLDAAYAWAWEKFGRIDVDIRAEAENVKPDATPAEAMALLSTEGESVRGVEKIRLRLQSMMAIAELDGTRFDLSDEVKQVQAMIAPEGSATAPYYSPPALDFSRPGRTWLQGRERARHAQGEEFDLKRWHLSAPSMGSLGLDELVDALATAGASA